MLYVINIHVKVIEISTSTFGCSILYSWYTLVCTTWWWPSQRPKHV